MVHLSNIIKRSNRPIGQSTLGKIAAAFVTFLVIVLSFGYIADEVAEGDTQRIDILVLQGIQLIANPLLLEIVKVVTFFGGVTMVTTLSVALIIYLIRKHRRRAAAFVACTMGGTLITFTLLKLLFERERPILQNLVHESTFSFPSGHASMSAALALTVILLAWHTKWRLLALYGGITYLLLIGFSRLYLTVHYPTDVIAGWLVAIAWVLVVATIIGALRWPEVKKLSGHQ